MKLHIILLAALLAGCSNAMPGSQAVPAGLSGATPAARHRRPSDVVQFAYVANFGATNISAYSIAAGGALTPVAGSPFKSGKNPSSLAIDPMGKFVYVTNFGSNDVSAYTIDATSGALKKVEGSPFAAGSNPLTVAVDSSGKFA